MTLLVVLMRNFLRHLCNYSVVSVVVAVSCWVERQVYSSKIHSLHWIDSINDGCGMLSSGPNGQMVCHIMIIELHSRLEAWTSD
jgi:hypothetical protein